MWTTRRDFEVTLFGSYELCGLKRARKHGSMGSVLWQVRADEKIEVPSTTIVGLSVLDDLISDAILWFNCFSALIPQYVRVCAGKTDADLFRCLSALGMKLVQDSIVTRDLIRGGYDVQARNLLRSINEHVNTIYYICIVPNVCGEFMLTQDEESANTFWYKHIRKARKVIDAKVKQILNVENFSHYRDDCQKILSTAHHPSYWAACNCFITPHKGDNMLYYICGIPSDNSFFTGRLLFYMLAELAGCIGALNGDVEKFIVRKRRDLFSKYVVKGRRHLVIMLYALIMNWNAPIFDLSTEMKDFREALSK
jgi:hypothetical protein